MASAFLRSKIDERAAITDVVEGIYKTCSDEQRDPSTEERAKLDEYSGRIKMLDGTIVELRTQEEANSRFLNTAARLEDQEELAERRGTERRSAEPQRMSAGEAFVQSEAFKGYRGYGTMQPVEFADFLGVETRAAIASAISTDDLHLPPYRVESSGGAADRTPFLSAIGRESVSANSVSYVTWGAATGALVVAETDTKPEATLVPTEVPINLATYAFWKAISRQALEDAPRIRSIVEGKLRTGLAQTLEAAAVAVLAGVAAPGVGAQPDLAGIRVAIAQLQGAGYTPTAVALNPADAASLDLAVMGGTLLGPSIPGSYWGLPVLAVPGIPAGTGYVGDFQNGVTWFDRSSASVYMSDSHADYFIRNLFVVLAEQRSAFALTEAAAVASVSITQPVGGGASAAAK